MRERGRTMRNKLQKNGGNESLGGKNTKAGGRNVGGRKRGREKEAGNNITEITGGIRRREKKEMEEKIVK